MTGRRHGSVDTDTLMAVANELAGFKDTPPDSAVYYPGHGIRKVLLGVDIGAGELLFARQYGFDAVIAHHPIGLVDGWRCFRTHVEHLVRVGVPHEEARAAIADRLEALAVRGQAENFDRLTSLSRLLDMPLINVHQAPDEVGRRILQGVIDECLTANPDATLADVAGTIERLPEFQAAPTRVQVLVGDPTARAGRTVMSLGAYTNGGHAVAAAYFRHGVDTVCYIHIDPAELAPMRAEGRGQLIVTGHIAGDAVGLYLYILRLEDLGLDVVRISGAISGLGA
jgi:hypothetical protein